MLDVLLVDDEPIVLNVLKQILIRLGHRVETAQAGEKGIVMFDRHPFDLVITDMVMAGMDGDRVAGHIRRSKRPETPIIGMSGTPWLLRGSTFNSVIPKPFTIEALQNAIHEALGGPAVSHRLYPVPALSTA